ncbi:hypothetical protein B0H19DRAFT_1171087 [Mycena capillaripes]|nr:hypothetical protein B0H19DRAFT_1171087 [Mycena capillaripes]
MPVKFCRPIFASLLVAVSCLSGAFGQQLQPQPQLGTLHRRTYFYVGQTYIPQGNSSIAAEQMYVEHLTPAEITQPHPILFIHGNAMTGTNFLNTPDGRLGWADYFLSKGYEPVILITHSESGEAGWILADSRPKQVKAIVALEPLGPPFINAVFPPFTPARIYGLTDIPVAYDPPISAPEDISRIAVSEIPGVTCFQQTKPARKLINLIDIPVLLVTSEAGYHAQYDNCSVEYLRDAGVSVEHVSLGDVGIHGNGHLFFIEKNGLQIVDQVVKPWISKIRK